jgi:hypothetical protein
VYSFPSILFVYFLPIGWIDHIYLVVLFGRETEKTKGMLLEYIHFPRQVDNGEHTFLHCFKFILDNECFKLIFLSIIEVDHVVQAIDDEVQVLDHHQR